MTNLINTYDFVEVLWLATVEKLISEASEEQGVSILAAYMAAADAAKEEGIDPYSAGYTAAEEKANSFGITFSGPELRAAYAEALKETLAANKDKIVIVFPDYDLTDTVFEDCKHLEQMSQMMEWFKDGYAFPNSNKPHVFVCDDDELYFGLIKYFTTWESGKGLAEHVLICTSNPYMNYPNSLINRPQLLAMDPSSAVALYTNKIK